MKKLTSILTGIAIVALVNSSALAGSCGSSEKHSHDAKEINAEQASSKEVIKKDIVETAIAAGSFNTLVAAVKAAGLVEALKGEGPFTVFAPTDEAFAKLPKGTVEALLGDKKKLSSILTYHVVDGFVNSEAVVNLDKAETLNGQSVNITVKDGKVMIDKALVTTTDIICSNGIIHVIDDVILPQ